MKAHYRRIAKQLKKAVDQLERVERERDLPGLHRLVVDLKTSLPERLSHENSQLLLGGLRVTNAEDLPAYTQKLLARLNELHEQYHRRAG